MIAIGTCKRRFLVLLSTTLSGVLLTAAVLSWDCDPRAPNICNDQPPTVGSPCATGSGVNCEWVDNGIREFRRTLLCRFRTPLCPSVPSNECNLRAVAVLECHEYVCRESGNLSSPCNDGPRKVFHRVYYISAGEDCSGVPCGPPPGTVIWGPPGTPRPYPVTPVIP
jgi:hypothetical protein